jgi:hypothetical protein
LHAAPECDRDEGLACGWGGGQFGRVLGVRVSYGAMGKGRGGVDRYVPPERGRVRVATGLEGRLVGGQSAAATAGTGVAVESWRKARRMKARPRMKARNEGIVKGVAF